MGGRLGVLVLAAAALAAGPARAEDSGKPLPVSKTTILKSGGVYFVEGRVRIPKGVELTVQKDTSIVGRGEGATIEVVGKLAIHGVGGSEVPVENVTIELQALFEDVRVDKVVFKGSSKGIVTAAETACNGRLMVLNTEFRDAATVDILMSGNEVDLQRAYMNTAPRIRAADPQGASSNKVKLNVLNCCGSSGASAALMGGLFVERVSDVTVRGSRLEGDKVSFVDCGKIEFDGNQVKCRSLEFTQTVAGRFGRTTMSNCDVLGERIVAFAPATAGKSDVLSVDKCWFNDVTEEKKVREKWFKAGEGDSASSVTVKLTKIMERPLQLAGPISK